MKHLVQKELFHFLAVVILVSSSAYAQEVVIQFTGMNPHIGQKVEARLVDKRTMLETDRVSMDEIIEAEFDLTLVGERGESYFVDFYADLSGNGRYNAPPADHAWRVDVNDLDDGSNIVNFSHNTNFTEIGWKQLLTLDFTGMTPHVGQMLQVAVRDKNQAGKEVGRATLEEIQSADFQLELPFLENGHSYFVDFYADLNQNGRYDPPPTDHAWRLDLDEVAGDESAAFGHNTGFTDIEWRHMLSMEFNGMNPHVGQRLEVIVRDINQVRREVGRYTLPAILDEEFTVFLPFLRNGRSYTVDFYADFNQNGKYDAPPADHAWRMLAMETEGDEDLDFNHNTDFTDIGESGVLTVAFTGMNPHVGQLLELRVQEVESGREIERYRGMIEVPDFELQLPGLVEDQEYQVDFYADLNQNGIYDAPPADHAWRQTFTSGGGNHRLDFDHNTDFADVAWPYMMTLAATGMNPHLGQKLEGRVVATGSGAEIGDFSLPAIEVPFFFMRVPGLEIGENYDLDFYADFNQSGSYDSPPADHAWRVNFDDDAGDEIVEFSHNTNFTDIMFTSAVREIAGLEHLAVYPVPFHSRLHLSIRLKKAQDLDISLHDGMGRHIAELSSGTLQEGENNLHFELLPELQSGIYFLWLQDGSGGAKILPLLRK